MLKNMSSGVVLLGAVLILIFCAPVKCGGGGKGDGPARRSGKSISNELAAAAGETAHNETLAAHLQAEEDKKSAENNTGGYSNATIARDLQEKENAKAASGTRVKPCPRCKPKSNSTNGTVSLPGPFQPCLSGLCSMQHKH